jgi:hypothetical protein
MDEASPRVVPANAGTHNHSGLLVRKALVIFARTARLQRMGPRFRRDDTWQRSAFAGTTLYVLEKLRLQDRRAGRHAAFQIDMRLGSILQRVGVIDRYVQLPVDDGGKQGVGALQ